MVAISADILMGWMNRCVVYVHVLIPRYPCVAFASVRLVRNGETQFSNFTCRDVNEMRRVRWDFWPSTRSVFLAGMAWVDSSGTSPAITKRLSGWSRRSIFRADFCEANRITYAESKLREAIVSPKQSWQSIWAEMPCPGWLENDLQRSTVQPDAEIGQAVAQDSLSAGPAALCSRRDNHSAAPADSDRCANGSR